MNVILRNNNFRIGIIAYSDLAGEYLKDFLSLLPPGFLVSNQDIKEVEWKLHLVTPEPIHSIQTGAGNPGILNWGKLHQAWQHLEPGWTGNSLYALESSDDGPSNEYIHFIPDDRDSKIGRVAFGVHLHQIMKRWLMASGNILLHAAGISHRDHGFLFLGSSGAGKSTVSMLCPKGDCVLHDDTVFLCLDNGKVNLFSPPDLNEDMGENSPVNLFNKQSINDFRKVSLLSIFILNKDSEDKLESLAGVNLAHALMASFLDMPRISMYSPSHRELRAAMNILSGVARQIPGYELHFRKSPNFWSLIDERIPD